MNFNKSLLFLTSLSCSFLLAVEGDQSPSFMQGALTTFEGQYIRVDHDGHVTITQQKYPMHKTSQSLMPPFRQVGSPVITFNPDGTYSAMIRTEPYPEGHILDPLPTETKLTGEPYDIVKKDQTTVIPYFSCGRLMMHFTNLPQGLDKFCGSAAAIDKNLLITAAHNFFPSHINGKSNVEGLKANTVNFEHLLINTDDRRGSYHIHVASHCYIHPEWEKSFDARYDIALVFLSQCLMLTEQERDDLLRLQVLPESVKGSIRIVGYPETHPVMRESKGDLKEGDDSSMIIYHRANTQGGSSGSPIIKGEKSIIGIHAYGTSDPEGANSGVRIRYDLLPFIEESIRLSQLILDDEEKAQEEKDKMHEKYEAEKAEKHRLEGVKEGILQEKMATARNMIIKNKSNEDILEIIGGLTAEQIENLRQILSKEQAKKRAHNEELNIERKPQQPLSDERR